MSSSDFGCSVTSRPSLRSQREAAGLSLRGLAARSGFSASYLSRVETGRRSATAAVVRLYAALGPAMAEPTSERVPASLPSRPGAVAAHEATWFGSEVRRLRMAAGKSLDALGTEVYLSRSQLGKIEQGDARGSYQLALSLDTALDAHGRLTRLFLEECARVGPVAPDIDILARGDPEGARDPDPDGEAAAATARLQMLRARSHQAGPHAIVHDLGDDIAQLYNLAGGAAPDAANPVWPVMLRYAELLGWTAQETGHDAIALRWTRAMADWAQRLGDTDALGYALIRQSQRARRRGDADTAVTLARQAGAMGGISPRLAQYAAQREAQASALAGDEAAYRKALDRYQTLVATSPQTGPDATQLPLWGPAPDPAFERSRLLEATCLVDLAGFRTATALFDQGMARLGTPRTGYARLAIRHAIAYAHIGEPEHACQIMLGSLPTVASQGSASLRDDLRLLTRALNRHRRSPAVRVLLPDLTTVARATSSQTHRPDTDES
ncbi:MAG TPA: helix-turn-helix transcriptional regulator [Trebonia sp.]|nr:helix-turn-helix transcriptional regulator [Trebonia sp.]